MIEFQTIIKKFDKKGEKTGWTYIEIPFSEAQKINPNKKTSFAVKGKLDFHPIYQTSLLPMGNGDFILPLNATLRKAIGKNIGYIITVQLELDNSLFTFSADFLLCLSDELKAKKYFDSLPFSHQKYFSKWIDSAKSVDTKSKRIAMAINALSKNLGFSEMMQANKINK